MIFVINQIAIGWVINLLLFWVNYDSGNEHGVAFALAALVLSYFHEGLNAGLWAYLGQGHAETEEQTKKRTRLQTALFAGVVILLSLSFIDYYVNT